MYAWRLFDFRSGPSHAGGGSGRSARCATVEGCLSCDVHFPTHTRAHARKAKKAKVGVEGEPEEGRGKLHAVVVTFRRVISVITFRQVNCVACPRCLFCGDKGFFLLARYG